MSNVQVDDSQVQNLFSKLGNCEEVMFKALKKGAEALQESTTNLLKSRLGAGATSGKRLGRPMTRGIKIKADKAYNEIVVHIMGDFRLKWFEKGISVPRKTRKTNSNRGTIRGYNFFRDSRTSGIEDIITRSIDEQLR